MYKSDYPPLLVQCRSVRQASIEIRVTSFVEKGGRAASNHLFHCFVANPPTGGFFVGCILFPEGAAFFCCYRQ